MRASRGVLATLLLIPALVLSPVQATAADDPPPGPLGATHTRPTPPEPQSPPATPEPTPPAPAPAKPSPAPKAVVPKGVSRAGRLDDLGCFIDGRGTGTRLKAAIARFQAANRLKQSMKYDNGTNAALTSPSAKSCINRPVPTGSGGGRRIVVSQRQNWIWMINSDGSVYAQGGIVDNPELDPDTYRTGPHCGKPGRIRQDLDKTRTLRLDYFVRFADCGYGFHGIPVSLRTGNPIHADYLVGTNLQRSHGCLRMPIRTIKKLWKFTEQATKVVVVRG